MKWAIPILILQAALWTRVEYMHNKAEANIDAFSKGILNHSTQIWSLREDVNVLREEERYDVE